MLNYVVVSDNHGSIDFLDIIKNRYENFVLIHLGDFELEEDLLENTKHFIVRGNSPIDPKFDFEKVLEIEDNKIFITHGHLYDVKNSRFDLSRRSLELGCKYALYGHTHILKNEIINDVLCLCPGSVSRPNGSSELTYATLELSSSKVLEFVLRKLSTGEEIWRT